MGNLNNETIVSKVLRSLTKDFDHAVDATKESKDLSKYSFDELMGSLSAHEVRISGSYDKVKEKVFQVKGIFLTEENLEMQMDKAEAKVKMDIMVKVVATVEEEVSLASSINPKAIYNVDIATNLATKRLNVGLSRKMRQKEPTMLKKLQKKEICLWLILQLTMMLMEYSSWTVAARII